MAEAFVLSAYAGLLVAKYRSVGSGCPCRAQAAAATAIVVLSSS
jgi:hypothetical protein